MYDTNEMTALLPLQYSLEKHFLHQLALAKFGSAPDPTEVTLQRFPYPAFYPEDFNTSFSRLIFHFGIGFFVPFASVVARATTEKCSGMRVHLLLLCAFISSSSELMIRKEPKTEEQDKDSVYG